MSESGEMSSAFRSSVRKTEVEMIVKIPNVLS